MINLLIESFDIIAFFENRGISYFTEDTNCSDGWVNIQCPFCDDHSNHLGIAIDTKKVHCWRCGKHSLFDLIKEIDGIYSSHHVYRVLKEFKGDINDIIVKSTVKENKLASTFNFPKEFSKKFPPIAIDYLKSRNFVPVEYYINKYDLYWGGSIVGNFKYRIIFPVKVNGSIVSFVGRDVTDILEPRYKNCPKVLSTIAIENTFFNVDNCFGNKVILVEGPFDVMRIGDGCIGSFGIQLSDSQIKFLSSNYDEVTIVFDSDAIEVAKFVANQIGPFLNKVRVIHLEKGFDPATLPDEDINILRRKFL